MEMVYNYMRDLLNRISTDRSGFSSSHFLFVPWNQSLVWKGNVLGSHSKPPGSLNSADPSGSGSIVSDTASQGIHE